MAQEWVADLPHRSLRDTEFFTPFVRDTRHISSAILKSTNLVGCKTADIPSFWNFIVIVRLDVRSTDMLSLHRLAQLLNAAE